MKLDQLLKWIDSVFDAKKIIGDSIKFVDNKEKEALNKLKRGIYLKNKLKKGSKVYVEGQLETRKWQDQTGNDRYTTEVVLRPYRGELTMLDSRNSSSDLQGSDYSQLQNTSQNSDFSNSDQENFSSNDMDDEIPF